MHRLYLHCSNKSWTNTRVPISPLVEILSADWPGPHSAANLHQNGRTLFVVLRKGEHTVNDASRVIYLV